MEQEHNNRPRAEPEPPPPSATPSEVRVFIADYLLYLGYARTQTEAEEFAGRSYLNGEVLYTCPADQWRIDYGNAGLMIFNRIERSKYGSKRGLWFYLEFLHWGFNYVGIGSGGKDILWDKKEGFSVITIILLALAAGLHMFKVLCGIERITRWKHFPERLKIRGPVFTG